MKAGSEDRRRQNIREFMKREGLSPHAWSKASGLAENTLPRYLKGYSSAITSKSLDKLAAHAGATIEAIVGKTTERQEGSPAPTVGGAQLPGEDVENLQLMVQLLRRMVKNQEALVEAQEKHSRLLTDVLTELRQDGPLHELAPDNRKSLSKA